MKEAISETNLQFDHDTLTLGKDVIWTGRNWRIDNEAAEVGASCYSGVICAQSPLIAVSIDGQHCRSNERAEKSNRVWLYFKHSFKGGFW